MFHPLYDFTMPFVECQRILLLRSIDDRIIEVTDEKIIRESDFMKFAIFQAGDYEELIKVPLNSIDADAVHLLIRLAECFRNDPPYSNNVKDFECMPSDHPAIKFTHQLSSAQFIAVSKAARCLRAPRLLDFLSVTKHYACTPELITTFLKDKPFWGDHELPNYVTREELLEYRDEEMEYIDAVRNVKT